MERFRALMLVAFFDLVQAAIGKEGSDKPGRGEASEGPTLMEVGRRDVRDFGAKCDGETDDAEAIRKAIMGSPEGGGEVVFPSGDCLISPIRIRGKRALRLRGAGRFASNIVLRSPGTAMTFSESPWLTITEMSFSVLGKPQSVVGSYGVEVDSGSGNGHIDAVSFIGFSGGGLRLIGSERKPLSGFNVNNCYFLGNGGDQFFSERSNDFYYGNNQFGSLEGVRHATSGAHLVKSSAGTYSLNRFEMSDYQNVYLAKGVQIIFTSNKIHTGSLSGEGEFDNVYLGGTSEAVFADNLIF